MSTAGRPVPRRPRWLAGLLACAALLVLTVPATAAPSKVKSGTLAGDTSITWRGNAGIVLRVPRAVPLPKSAMKLYVTGGTYAFVRMFGHRSESPKCVPLCTVRELTYIREMADLPIYNDGVVGTPSAPGDDHFTTYSTEPPVISKMNRLEVYLFTDGIATLKLRAAGLPGRASYVAGGRTRATTRKLPATCLTTAGSACAERGDGYAGAVTFGGLRVDVGPRGGAVDVFAFQRNARKPEATARTNQLNGVRGCLQPGPMQPGSSADPALYPVGCNATYDAVDPNGTVQGVLDEANSMPGVNGATWHYQSFQNAFDQQYIGWRAVHVGTAGERAAYGVWIPAGIT